MRLPRPLAAASVALLVAAAPGLAIASPTYPGLITTDLSLDYTLGPTDCIICHATNSGGVGTVIQPFGEAMRGAGLVLENPASLKAALTALADAKTDSDCNGTPDITQLEDGQNPNTGAYLNGDTMTPPPDPGCGDPPLYGCGARIAPAPASSPWQGQGVATLLVGLVALLARRQVRSRLSGR
jgi:MYXO-CTERM domain-containing protein